MIFGVILPGGNKEPVLIYYEILYFLHLVADAS